MPKVKPNESLDHYLPRCIPAVLKESGIKGRDHAVGKCVGMYKQSKKVNNRESVPEGVQVLRNASCPTGKGGGVVKGLKGRYAEDEQEVLFPSTQKFKVVKVETIKHPAMGTPVNVAHVKRTGSNRK